jgi:hypothetical protein
MRLFYTALALFIAAALTSSAFAAQGYSTMKSGMMKSSTHVTVHLMAQNGSGETGTATLTQMGSNVRVSISLMNVPAMAQPAHIHTGTCANLNPAPKYPLTNVLNGKSMTTVHDVTLSTLTNGHYAINVHKSTNDLKTYVACGNIRK